VLAWLQCCTVVLWLPSWHQGSFDESLLKEEIQQPESGSLRRFLLKRKMFCKKKLVRPNHLYSIVFVLAQCTENKEHLYLLGGMIQRACSRGTREPRACGPWHAELQALS
jgi:hypothetical protein